MKGATMLATLQKLGVMPSFTCQLHKSSASERFRVIKNGIFGAKRRVA
jgi:hypothetical protein